MGSDCYRTKELASSMIEQVEVLIKKIRYRRNCCHFLKWDPVIHRDVSEDKKLKIKFTYVIHNST